MQVQDLVRLAMERLRASDVAAAQALLRQALAAEPQDAQVLNILGVLAHQTGRAAEAVELLGRATASHPQMAEYHVNHGAALAAAGKIDEAIAAYRRALALKPDSPEALSNLGDAYCQKKEWAEAITTCRQALALRPGLPEANCNLAAALQATGKTEQALAHYTQALAARPNYMQALNNVANLLAAQRNWPAAVPYYQRALAVNPNAPEIRSNLADSLAKLGDLDGAVREYRAAIALRPNFPEAQHNLAHTLARQGQTAQAIAFYKQASDVNPNDASMAGDRLLALHFSSEYDAPAIARELRQWGEKYGRPLLNASQPHALTSNAASRLRIGYVSADFREHAVGWNIYPILQHHDRQKFEVFCYGSVRRPDAMTGRISACADVWRDIANMTDEAAAELIRRDRIDILVDLSLHSAGSRLMVFARKPAPVQVTYLGYAGSTGLPAMDYRISDAYLDPPGTDESIYVEKPLRLPHCYWCYQPGGPAPEVSPAPSQSNGFVRFGFLGQFGKSAGALELWAEVLRQTPDSRLVLNCPAGSARQGVLEQLGAGRVEFVADQPWPQYMGAYQQIDIALDPFPYNGAITTCDALWMGVPVITLAGRTQVGRAGISILSTLGLNELIAQSPQEYVQIARNWPQSLPLRANLRRRMAESTLMNAQQFALDIEAAYCQAWGDFLCRFPNS